MFYANPRLGTGVLLVGLGLACRVFAAGHSPLEAHLHPPRAPEFRTANNELSLSLVGFPIFDNETLSGLNLASECEAALGQTVDCADETSSLMTNTYIGSFGNSTLMALVCDSGCEASIAQVHHDVAASCGESAELVPGLPLLGLVDMLWSNWNQSCFVDPETGENCNDIIDAYSDDTDLEDLPLSDLCSYCFVEKLALMQADAYTGVYNQDWQSLYESVAAVCNLTIASFNATDSAFNVTVDVDQINCVSGNTYTTEIGETCDSIALANSLSGATMFYMNSNIINCSAIAEGTILCLPMACNSVYMVQENDTCSTIAADSGILTSDVLSYNTQLNWNCSNLHATKPYWGSTLCVSTPGGNYTGVPLNHTATPDESGTAVAPPAGVTVADGTTLDCGKWYVADGSLSCTQVCLSNLISINVLTAANPSLHKTTCDADLVLGSAYCVDPLTQWHPGNATATTTGSQPSSATQTETASTVASSCTETPASSTEEPPPTSPTASSDPATPSPTQTGAIDTCTAWHLVDGEDTCWSICEEQGISLDDFILWNSGVGETCDALWLGYYVCVGVSE